MHYDLEQEITGSRVILSFQAMKRGQTNAKRNVCAHIESLSFLASRSTRNQTSKKIWQKPLLYYMIVVYFKDDRHESRFKNLVFLYMVNIRTS